ncbi:MAG: hypothetical protein HUU22_16310 [Phycisphaerae bacterium]|nr:hypothetical protein [Phycisphaerae bacterium]NUQ47585.1 hypothetical protein [Phycisphaerae bacterium]
MQTRFYCPACRSHHVLDMPETTIHITCSRTGKHLRLDLGVGGEPVVKILADDGSEEETMEESETG